MRRPSSDLSGFTLVELLIVVIMVGILATVSIPLYRGATKQAYLTEADAGLGLVSRSLRTVIMSQTGYTDWSILASKYTAGPGLKVSSVSELRIADTDLNGRFFDNNAYRLQVLTASTYTIYAYGDSSTTANKDAVAGLIRTLDQSGQMLTYP